MFKSHLKALINSLIMIIIKMAGVTGLEPAASCVTGRRSNQTELHPQMVGGKGLEPMTLSV